MRRKNSSQARERRRYFFHTRYEAMLQGELHPKTWTRYNNRYAASRRACSRNSAGVGVARDAELATNRPSMDDPAPLAI